MSKETFAAGMISPAYIAKFNCLGPTCPDHCCSKWEVLVDQADYQALRQLPDAALAAQARQALQPLPPERQTPFEFAKLQFVGAEQSCVFLDEQRLCKIHAQLGAGHLADVCDAYPRSIVNVGGVWRQSAALSCPEMARLCLQDPAAMQFEEREVTTRASFARELQATAGLNQADLDLHYFFIQLLQQRDYPFWQRLALMAMTCHEVDTLLAERRQADIPALIDGLSQAVLTGESHRWFEPVQGNLASRVTQLGKLLIQGIGQNSSPIYLKTYLTYCNTYGIAEHYDPEKMAQDYQLIWREKMLPFLGEHPHFLENLFINQLFRSAFPVGALDEGHSYLSLCIGQFLAEYMMLMLLLSGLAGGKAEALSIEEATAAVQALSKAFGHSKMMEKGVREWANGPQPIPVLLSLLAEPS